MDNFSGTMIEMNVHMQSRGYAEALILLGAILAIMSFIFFMLDFRQSKRFKKEFIPYIVSLLLGGSNYILRP